MPSYDYRCTDCGAIFTETHGFEDVILECPECESDHVQRIITTVPTIAKGIEAHAGDGRRASKEQLRSKWAEETPKLRKKLEDKLGKDAVKDISTLHHKFDHTV